MHFLFLQLIFRKVSDVKKEKELAERRKNDPALNHTQDHLVRKLFSKFKKGPEAMGGKDLERGESFQVDAGGMNNGNGASNAPTSPNPHGNSNGKFVKKNSIVLLWWWCDIITSLL